MAGTGCDHKGLRVPKASGIAALLTAILLASGCATYRLSPTSTAVTEAQRKTCDEFARAEVRRLGESVPAAFVKGFLVGLDVDLSTAMGLVHVQYGAAQLEPLSEERPTGTYAKTWERGGSPRPNGVNVSSPLFPLPWSLMGGPQLARNAARTNEDMYEQAIQRCMAPILLAQELGPMHASVATSLELLANCYMWQHKYAQAEPLQRQAVAIWETVFAPNDPRVARALQEYAEVLRHVHRVAEADSLTDRAAAIRAQLSPPTSPTSAATPRESVGPRCDSPLSAAIFVLCRGVRLDLMPTDTP